MIWPWGGRRGRREAELDEEIAAHLAMAAHDREARGEAPEEAAYAARREFGNATLVKEFARQTWGGAWLDQTLQDLRLAVRSLGRSPGFLAVAVLALGLGLGLSTAMFGVVDAVLHPIPQYANADRLCSIASWSYGFGRGGARPPTTDPFELLNPLVHSFDAILPYKSELASIESGLTARDFQVASVPAEWFNVVGLRPAVGRAFTAGDGDAVAVVSADVWRFISNGRRTLDGVHVVIGGEPYLVVGVMAGRRSEFGAVIPLTPEAARRGYVQHLFGLKPGVTLAAAQADVKAAATLLSTRYWPGRSWYFSLVAAGQKPEPLRDVQRAMVAAALAVLLIACVNLAHLMLARGLAKRRELAVRMALGAGRGRVARVMLAEGLLVGTGGVILGAIIAVWGSHFLQNLMPPEISWVSGIHFQLSWRVFAAGAVVAVGAGVLFGLLPAVLVALGVDLTAPLKADVGTTTGRERWRYNPLVAAEVALALALLMGGALLLRSVGGLRKADMGFNPSPLVTASVRGNMNFSHNPGRVDTVTVDWAQALARAAAVPGVQAAALEGHMPVPGFTLTAEMGGGPNRVLTTPDYLVVTADYLRVYGLPVQRGRDFAAGDAAGNGVAILSTVAAARLYPGGDAVGRMLKLGSPRSNAPWVPIVGVARTPVVPWDREAPAGGRPLVWVAGAPRKWRTADILVRASGPSADVAVALRHELQRFPMVAGLTVEPYTWVRDGEIASRTFLAEVFAGMGTLGLALAALGLYGVLSYAVARRMREFAVRITLGAEPHLLFRLVLHDGLVMLLAGTGVGAFGALAAAYLLNAVLIGVYPVDALSLVAAEAALLAVGLVAAVVPARRAVSADPVEILRAV